METWIYLLICLVLTAFILSFSAVLTRIKKKYETRNDKLSEELQTLKEAMSCTDEYLFSIDLQSESLWGQAGLFTLLSIQSDTLLMPLEMAVERVHKDDIDKLTNIYEKAIVHRGLFQSTFRVRHKEGYYLWLHIRGKVIMDKSMNPAQIVGSVMNVTTLVAVENELKDAHRKIEQSKNMNSAFLVRMSHDIRTPLNAITGYVQLMERELKQDDAMSAQIKVVKRASKELLDIMSEIIDAGRLEAGEIKLRYNRVKLAELVKHYHKLYAEDAENKGIGFVAEYEGDDGAEVLIDELRLNQIVLNLISNAVKFTSKGVVHFRLEVERISFSKFEIIIEIGDTGPGIQNRHLIDYVNDELSDETINIISEDGLGLSIVCNLVKIMQGEISVISYPETGTKFTIRLQVDEVRHEVDEAILSGEDLSQVSINRKTRILVAEDNEINRMLISDMLRMFDINHVDLTENGEEALRLFKNNEYGMIITDIQMPVMDGVALTMAIRKIDEKIPIIAMTANILDEQLTVYYKAGINDYVAKPVVVSQLKEVLDKYLIDIE